MSEENKLEIVALGTGTSQGVPVIGCQCDVCLSQDPRDNRLRSAILFRYRGENFVVDTGPDFRQQMLREDIRSLRAVLYTHSHKDHIAGMDDVRSFNFLERRDMELYCNQGTEEALKREFYYAFEENKYPGVPNVNLTRIDNKEFTLPDGPKVTPIQMYHYKMPVLGFRIGDFAYLTDVKSIPDEEMDKLKGVRLLILDCLREKEHISHLNLKEALEIVDDIKPEKTYLTHISHLFDKHENILKKLPPHVEPAYDGLRLETYI
jgi:phosphoribosyl 1,2-cyclic phosphate phosphodiesterase